MDSDRKNENDGSQWTAEPAEEPQFSSDGVGLDSGPVKSEDCGNDDDVNGKGGQILSWGCGEFGQHGHGTTDTVSTDESPVRYLYDQTAKMGGGDARNTMSSGSAGQGLKIFACGASHTVVVTESDEIYTWGNGNSGQLGCGDKDTHLTPQRVRLPTEGKAASVKGVACGSRHTVLWKENGLCFSWGNNFYAQLGYDFRIENYKDNQVSPHMLSPIAHLKVVQVACGEKHTMFLYDTGIVATCGSSTFGQLGSGNRGELVSPKALDYPEGVTHIACGANHSLAITASGELYSWGLGRACGQRREDVLRPLRQIMHRSDALVAAAGGSAHSVALSASGRVYTWGGGTEGQLGHGSKVLYLSDPRPLSHDALPRFSQISCGDSYTAAVTSDGILYMWGKSSYVIPTPGNPNPSTQHPTPVRVTLGDHRVSRVACGSWHAMAVTGHPEWQPLMLDSESDDMDSQTDDSDSSSDSMDAQSSIVDVQPKDIHPESILVNNETPLEPSIDQRMKNREQQTYPIRREATKLTLAEFYAPTPLPTIIPHEEFDDEMESGNEGDAEGVDSDAEAALTPEETRSGVLDSQREATANETVEESTVSDSSRPVTKEDSRSFFVDIAPKAESASGNDHYVRDKPKQAKEEAQLGIRPGQRQVRTRAVHMVRSKTMPVVNRKPLKLAPASTTTGFDWSEPPKATPDSKHAKDRFVIHKHVSIQMKGSGSGDKAAGKKPIPQVGVLGSRDGEARPGRSVDKNAMPQPPKFNRAKTYYGKMNHGKKVEAEPRLSKFLSSLPSAPSQMSSAPAKTQSRRRAALEKPTGSSDRSPIRSKPGLDLAPTVSSELRGQLRGKPQFSSASSWRSRKPDGDV